MRRALKIVVQVVWAVSLIHGWARPMAGCTMVGSAPSYWEALVLVLEQHSLLHPSCFFSCCSELSSGAAGQMKNLHKC